MRKFWTRDMVLAVLIAPWAVVPGMALSLCIFGLVMVSTSGTWRGMVEVPIVIWAFIFPAVVYAYIGMLFYGVPVAYILKILKMTRLPFVLLVACIPGLVVGWTWKYSPSMNFTLLAPLAAALVVTFFSMLVAVTGWYIAEYRPARRAGRGPQGPLAD